MRRMFVDFYQKNKVTPVSQDISNMKAHFNRRAALYRHLGIIPDMLEGKSIIEFGAGSGHNALFTISCRPAKYVFVDGNKHGLEETRQRIEQFKLQENLDTELYFHHSLIENYRDEKKFDLVVCEGLLPFQSDPSALLSRVTDFQKPGGVISITCIDTVSYLSDSLRKLMGLIISRSMGKHDNVVSEAQTLVPFFTSQFKNLKGMSRPIVDWILDNVLQPFCGKTFSIADALTVMSGRCVVLGCSPRFYSDWRWYKEITDDESGCNELMLHSYWENLHNFLDYTVTAPPRDEDENKAMATLTDHIFDQVMIYQSSGDWECIHAVLDCLDKLQPFVASLGNGKVSRRLYSAKNILEQILTGCTEADCSEFCEFFGRGQQYLSFIKN